MFKRIMSPSVAILPRLSVGTSRISSARSGFFSTSFSSSPIFEQFSWKLPTARCNFFSKFTLITRNFIVWPSFYIISADWIQNISSRYQKLPKLQPIMFCQLTVAYVTFDNFYFYSWSFKLMYLHPPIAFFGPSYRGSWNKLPQMDVKWTILITTRQMLLRMWHFQWPNK